MLLAQLRPATWPWLIAVASLVFIAGCQDGSGPGLVTSPDAESTVQKKPQPPPSPNPEIATTDPEGRIYVLDADGGNATMVYNVGALVFGHGWSPDGSAITYATMDDGVWIVNVNGTNNHLLVDQMDVGDRQCANPCWSPTGTEIAFVATNYDDGPDVLVVPVAGGTPITLVDIQEPSSSLSSIEWNYDGTKLILGWDSVLGGDTGLTVIDRATGIGTPVLSGFLNVSWVDWGRQGLDTILFEAGDGDIYMLDISDPNAAPEFIVSGGPANGGCPSFSPDNSQFVFSWRIMAGWHSGRAGLAIYTFATGEVEEFRAAPLRPHWRR